MLYQQTRCLPLDVQAKSTTRAGKLVGGIRYDLDAQAYETLRHPAPGCPRILVVLLLPEDEKKWSTQTEEEFILRYCAYWLSLKGKKPTANRQSVRISIPRANVFSAEALQRIMGKIKTGEEL